jgi:hypothetical protein
MQCAAAKLYPTAKSEMLTLDQQALVSTVMPHKAHVFNVKGASRLGDCKESLGTISHLQEQRVNSKHLQQGHMQRSKHGRNAPDHLMGTSGTSTMGRSPERQQKDVCSLAFAVSTAMTVLTKLLP